MDSSGSPRHFVRDRNAPKTAPANSGSGYSDNQKKYREFNRKKKQGAQKPGFTPDQLPDTAYKLPTQHT